MGEDPLTKLTSGDLGLGLEVKAHPLQRALYLKLLLIETVATPFVLSIVAVCSVVLWIEHYCAGYALFNQAGRFIK